MHKPSTVSSQFVVLLQKGEQRLLENAKHNKFHANSNSLEDISNTPCCDGTLLFRTFPKVERLRTGEFTQQDGRKKRTIKRLYVTNVTGLLRACFDVIFT